MTAWRAIAARAGFSARIARSLACGDPQRAAA